MIQTKNFLLSMSLVLTSPLLFCNSLEKELHQAVIDQNAPKVKELLAKEIDKNTHGILSRTPLIEATYAGNLEIFQELLKAGANPDAVDRWGESALFHAAGSGNVKMVEMLLAKKARKDIVSTFNKRTALYMAEAQLEWYREVSVRPVSYTHLEHGANPGLVSHFTKSALEKISIDLITKTTDANQKTKLEKALSEDQFAQMAYITGTKVIHISERDTQLAVIPKAVNEFVGTWSIDGLYEEGLSPAELGWGTHEKTVPQAGVFTSPLRTHMCLDSVGINTLMYSWIPAGDIIGMLIRHGEAVSIASHLTLMDEQNNHVLYSPTVHYVYLVSDSTLASLHEMKMNGYIMQPQKRILYDEISTGDDELGVLLLGHHLNGWWEGTRLRCV